MKFNAATVKKLLDYNTHAYLYPDGVIVKTSERVKIGKQFHTVDAYYGFRGRLRWECRSYDGDHSRYTDQPPTRIVVHSGKQLVDGIQGVEVALTSSSPAMRERGLECTMVMLITHAGGEHREAIFNFLSSDFTVQFHKETFDGMLEAIRHDPNDVLVSVVDADTGKEASFPSQEVA